MKKIITLYPLLTGLALMMCLYYLDINFAFVGFEKVLDTVITFSSIVTGFLAALLGILVSIRDSDIVKEIFETKAKGELKYYFYESFSLGFVVVITSGLMYVLIHYDNELTNNAFYFWILIVIWFFLSTYRIVNILLSIFFNSNNSRNRPESNRPSENVRGKIRERLRKR